MSQILNSLFGGGQAAEKPIVAGDADFADFASVPDSVAGNAFADAGPAIAARPYTKWYRLDERYEAKDFRTEGLVFIMMAVVLVVHYIGARMNRNKARTWMRAHTQALADEFALVGFGRVPAALATHPEPTVALDTLATATTSADPTTLLKDNSLFEYATYATGRQNVAFVDVKLKLKKRFNPLMLAAEYIIAFFWDSMPAPCDTAEAFLYPFDGKEGLIVRGYGANGPAVPTNSAYDGFVWAIVNKEGMKTVREDRFDVSLTFTKDNAKLPPWLTVMSENAEITELLLTPELVEAATSAGELLEYLIISNLPTEKPTTIEETNARKRVFLKYRLPADGNYAPLLPIFTYFCRSADVLVQLPRLRPEVQRKLKATRDDVVKNIKKAEEEEKADKRALEREAQRKAKRETELNALDAKAQKKYLEREREKEQRRAAKKQTMRG